MLNSISEIVCLIRVFLNNFLLRNHYKIQENTYQLGTQKCNMKIQIIYVQVKQKNLFNFQNLIICIIIYKHQRWLLCKQLNLLRIIIVLNFLLLHFKQILIQVVNIIQDKEETKVKALRGQEDQEKQIFVKYFQIFSQKLGENSNALKRRKQFCGSVEELTTNKVIEDNCLFTNNNPSMENVGNFLDLLDDTPTKSLDVDYLNCNIIIKENERNYRISVFKYKGGPSGDKSPLLILCIDEIKKNDFMSLKEQILEKGHFIFNILEFFSGQLKTQMSFLNDHLKYNYSSHNLFEMDEYSDDAENLRTIEGINAGAGSGSRSYNIAESQDITSKSLVDINKTIKGLKYDKQNITGFSKDPNILNFQLNNEVSNQFPQPFLQKAINRIGVNDGQNNELYINNNVKGFVEKRQTFLAPPPPTAHLPHQKTSSAGNSPDNSPKRDKLSARRNFDVTSRKCDTLETSGNLNHMNNANNHSSKNFNQIKQNQNQTIQININNSSNNIINIQQTIGNNNNNFITNINNNNKNINTNNINITVKNNNINNNISNCKNINNNNTNSQNDNKDNQQFQKIQQTNQGILNSEDIQVILVNKSEMELMNEKKDKISNDKTKDILTLPQIIAKKIVSEQIFQDEEFENNQNQDSSIDKQILSEDEVINQQDRKTQYIYHDKLMKYNKNLIEICHNSKLIALKSLIQVSNYSDCFRHKESKPLPLRISDFSISELILDTFYFNSKPVLIYKSKYQYIKSDERRLIQVIFNILNFLMKKTDQSIKFIVMDKDEYDRQKLNQSISKQLSSRNKIDTAKFIHSNLSKMLQSHKGNENINEVFNKKKDVNNNFIILQDVKNSEISCNISSESTPYAKYPQNITDGKSQKSQVKILSDRQYGKQSLSNGVSIQSSSLNNKNTPFGNTISQIKDEYTSPNKLQNSRDVFQMTFNQNAINNIKTIQQSKQNSSSNFIQPDLKLQIQQIPNDLENINNFTSNNKIKTTDITPVSIHKDMSNFIMLTNNLNTQNLQESYPNISYLEGKYNQKYNKIKSSQNQEEIVLDCDFDENNDYYIAQKINEKKNEQNKYMMDSNPYTNHPSISLVKSQEEISSENYCESIQNENINDVVLNNLNYHRNEKNLKEIGSEENYQSHSFISNESRNQNQIIPNKSQTQSKATLQSMKLNNEIATALSNLKSVVFNFDGSNQINQLQNMQQFSFNRQLSYFQTNSKNGFKDGNGTNGLTSAIYSSSKLDNQNNKETFQFLPEKNLVDQNIFFKSKDTQSEDYAIQQMNSDQIFRNLINMQNQNQKINYNQQLLGESTNNLREPSKSMISGNGKNDIQSPTEFESQQNFNLQQSNYNNNLETPSNYDFQSNHKALPRSQFSKSLQQYPTVSFLPVHDKNNENLLESIPPEDIEFGQNTNNNFYSTPIDDDMFKSQNLFNNNLIKNVKLFEGQLKKKSSIKKNSNLLKMKSRADSNNSSIIQKQSMKSGTDINNQKLFSPTKRLSNLGNIQKLLQINPIQVNQEDLKKNNQQQNNKGIGEETNLFCSNSDVIVIEIQMEGENMKFIPDNNESIQMIATNEIIKLMGPNKKLQIGPNSISFFLYTNLDKCDLVRNQISNQEKFEELLNLKELMNPKAVQTIRQINRAIVDNKTCKTIYTLENQAHNFTLIEQEDLETHNKLQSEKLQNQLQQQNKQQNHTDFLSLHSFSKHNSPKLNNLTRSQVQPYQQINQKFNSARQDKRYNRSISPNSKSFLSPQLNLQRVFQGNTETLVSNAGNLAQSFDHKNFYQTNKSIKDNDYLQSYTQRTQVPSSTQQYQNSYNLQRQDNLSGISNNRFPNSSKISFKKILLDENKSAIVLPSKITSLQTATTHYNQIKSQQYLQKSFTTNTNKSCVFDQQ